MEYKVAPKRILDFVYKLFYEIYIYQLNKMTYFLIIQHDQITLLLLNI